MAKSKLITKHTELDVYQKAFAASMRIFELSKKFPRDEVYSMTDQMRRCARSVFANIAEGWRKRRYPNSFALSLNTSEAEAAETQAWIQSAVACKYIPRATAVELYREYDEIISILVNMINNAERWKLTGGK